mgnify:CR=1 FL=1|tara:strand:+ start:2975 stop:3601 length:627 start_codon:yes stop_codon:yes gene_type:complete
MKTSNLLLASAVLCALSAPAFADDVVAGGNYARLSAGIIVPEDLDGDSGGTPVTITFDSGWTASAAVGTWLNDNLTVEGEVSYLAADFKDGTVLGVTVPIDGSFTSTLALANANFHFAGKASGFDPYVGGGVGAAFSEVDLKSVGGVAVNDKDSDTNLAAQATAGLNLNLSSGLAIGAQYRYLYIDSGSGSSDGFTAHNVTANVTLAF